MYPGWCAWKDGQLHTTVDLGKRLSLRPPFPPGSLTPGPLYYEERRTEAEERKEDTVSLTCTSIGLLPGGVCHDHGKRENNTTIHDEMNNQLRSYVSWQPTLVAAISFVNVLSLCRNGLYLVWTPGRQRKWQLLSIYVRQSCTQVFREPSICLLAVLKRNAKCGVGRPGTRLCIQWSLFSTDYRVNPLFTWLGVSGFPW